MDPHANLAIRRSLCIKADIEAAESQCAEVVREFETRGHRKGPLEVEVHRRVIPVDIAAEQVETGANIEAVARLRGKRETSAGEHIRAGGTARDGEDGWQSAEQDLLIKI